MTDVIDRPPVAGAPPALPPYPQRRRGGPERRVLIIPDIRMAGHVSRLPSVDNNWYTIIYHWMIRIVGESMFDPEATWEPAHTSMRRYRAWLETYDMADDIPPHIQFGGAIEPGEGNPTFLPRWKDYAREMFA